MARRFLFAQDPVAAGARLLVPLLERIDAQRGRVRLAVAGGSAMGALGQVRRALAPGVWGRLLLTWVDERCVPFADAESNRGGAYRQGHLDPGQPPALELPLYLDSEAPEAACARVASALDGPFQGRLDVLLLGLGEDGHIASLFPGRPQVTGATVFAVLDSPKPPPSRITLSLGLLAAAESAVLVAMGAGKRRALERLAAGDPQLPGCALQALTVLSDLEGLG